MIFTSSPPSFYIIRRLQLFSFQEFGKKPMKKLNFVHHNNIHVNFARQLNIPLLKHVGLLSTSPTLLEQIQ